MKNKLLKTILGIGIFAVALNVNAETLNSVEEGSNTSSYDVTVGSVDVPVYSVEIKWDSLIFDWKYDSQTREYNWVSIQSVGCTTMSTDVEESTWDDVKATLYTDSTCETKIADDITYDEVKDNLSSYYTVYQQEGTKANNIYITDYSENGQIVPSIEWNSASGYEFVSGTFKYEGLVRNSFLITTEDSFNYMLEEDQLYLDEQLTQKVTDTTVTFEEGKYYGVATGTGLLDLTTKEIPDDGRNSGMSEEWYRLELSLTNDTSKTITTPKAGDKIGTVTITIEAKN